MEGDIYYNMFEEGGALIRPINCGFDLYEIPQYGGEPRYFKWFQTIEEAKKQADEWT